MKFSEYVGALSFRWAQPSAPMPPQVYNRLARALVRLNFQFDIVNTRLPVDEDAMRGRLRPLCLIPKMSTFAIGALINQAVAAMADGQAFVNVGVWNGFTLLAGMVGNPQQACVGVNNFSQFGGPREELRKRFERYGGPRHTFHDMDYREYFEKHHQGPIGVYAYDGEHSYDNQLHGLRLAEPFFADGCVIFVDDANVTAVQLATRDFIAQSGRRYQILLNCPTRNNCHPTLWNGLMVLQCAD